MFIAQVNGIFPRNVKALMWGEFLEAQMSALCFFISKHTSLVITYSLLGLAVVGFQISVFGSALVLKSMPISPLDVVVKLKLSIVCRSTFGEIQKI